MTLEVEEFIRRFLIHVLPDGFQKIRYFGWMANRHRASARITVRNFGDTCPHESGDPNLNRRVEFWIIPADGRASDVDKLKKCGAGATPQIITTEEPAPSVEKKPARRVPRRRAAPKEKPGEPVGMILQPETLAANQ